VAAIQWLVDAAAGRYRRAHRCADPEELTTDDTGHVLHVGTVYWYPQYDVTDPVAQLLQNGYVDFVRGEEAE